MCNFGLAWVSKRQALKFLGLMAATLGASFSAWAQAFPTGPVTMVVGFTPGGSNDVIARTIAPKLGEALGVNVVVENRPGAAGAVGTAYTVNAKPDGHVITLGSTSVFSIGPIASANLPYKLTDLQAVSMVAASASIIAVNPNLPAKTMPELIALAKKRQVSLASAGAGGLSHLNIEFLRVETGGDFLHVAYKGAAPGITDVISGQVDGIVMDFSALQGMLTQGRLRAIAGSKPIDKIEASPMVISPWYGVVTSAKVPKSTIKTLHAAFAKVMADPDILAKFEKMGMQAFVLPTPEEADAYIRSDSARWAQVVKTAGVKFD